MFSSLPNPNLDFSFTFILLSANALNLDQSKILSFGKELRDIRSGMAAVLLNPSLVGCNLKVSYKTDQKDPICKLTMYLCLMLNQIV